MAGVLSGSPVFLEQKNEKLSFTSYGDDAHHGEALPHFFRWDDPLDRIAAAWRNDPVLFRAYRAYRGLRIVRQDPWECVVRFLLSMYSNIPKIERTLVNIARHTRKGFRFMGIRLHGIPPPREIASMREETLRGFGMGFRAPYLRACAKRITGGFPLPGLKSLPYAEAKRAIMELPGVGEKVADCILLFSLDKLEAFPVDVWMQRVLEEHYFGGKSKTAHYLSEWGRDRFGPAAGYAQQYLYALIRRLPENSPPLPDPNPTSG